MNEPFDNPQPVQADDKPDTDEPQAYKDDGKPKGTCSRCMMTFPLEVLLKVDKNAHCPACGAWFVNFTW